MKLHLYDRGRFIGFFTLFVVLVCLVIISGVNVGGRLGGAVWSSIMLISLFSTIPLPVNLADSFDGNKSKAEKIKDEGFFIAFWFLASLIGIVVNISDAGTQDPSGWLVILLSLIGNVIYLVSWIIRLWRAGFFRRKTSQKIKRDKKEGKEVEVLYQKSPEKKEIEEKREDTSIP